MSPDFWAGYISGATGILIGNPLDILKVRLQSGPASPPIHSDFPSPIPRTTPSTPLLHSTPTPRPQTASSFTTATSLIRGVSAPILGYGALNALLFVTYNRTSTLLSTHTPAPLSGHETAGASAAPLELWKIWIAGAVGGLATWIISTPSEVVKCRTQLQVGSSGAGSWGVARDILRRDGVRGLFLGGAVTAARDSIGYGFYFWAYELCSRALGSREGDGEAAKVLLCGGAAGVVTWLSVFPLDVVKTRVQVRPGDAGGPGSWRVAKAMYRHEGFAVFWRGLGVCSVRAFVVNAAQWAVYEWLMRQLSPKEENRLGGLAM